MKTSLSLLYTGWLENGSQICKLVQTVREKEPGKLSGVLGVFSGNCRWVFGELSGSFRGAVGEFSGTCRGCPGSGFLLLFLYGTIWDYLLKFWDYFQNFGTICKIPGTNKKRKFWSHLQKCRKLPRSRRGIFFLRWFGPNQEPRPPFFENYPKPDC